MFSSKYINLYIEQVPLKCQHYLLRCYQELQYAFINIRQFEEKSCPSRATLPLCTPVSLSYFTYLSRCESKAVVCRSIHKPVVTEDAEN
jgi:hypothetical protein